MTITVLRCADGTRHEAQGFNKQERINIIRKHGEIVSVEKRKYWHYNYYMI